MAEELSVALDVSAVPAKPAGAGLYVVELSRALSARGDSQQHLISRVDDGERWLAPGADVTAVVPSSRPARLLWEQTKLPSVVNAMKPDVYHGPHYTLPHRAKVPKVVTVHDMTLFDNPEWHERSKVVFFRHAIKSSIKQAQGIVAVSHDTANRLQDRFGPLDVTVIPHGVDHGRFNSQAKIDDTHDVQELAKHGIRGPFIAFVGTLEPRKDVPSLVAAFDVLAAIDPELSLVLVGRKGWGLDTIDAAIANAEHSDRIVRPGYLPDAVVPMVLRQARAVGYPSLVEGFGLPALEALACGAVLVTTSGSAMEEVVDDAALLVAPKDISGLVDALRTAINEDSVRDRLQKRGPEVAAGFTWEACAVAHLELYRSVAARR